MKKQNQIIIPSHILEITNVNKQTTREKLLQYFEIYGIVISLEKIQSKKKKKTARWILVYKEIAYAIDAINHLNGIEIDNNIVIFKYCYSLPIQLQANQQNQQINEIEQSEEMDTNESSKQYASSSQFQYQMNDVQLSYQSPSYNTPNQNGMQFPEQQYYYPPQQQFSSPYQYQYNINDVQQHYQYQNEEQFNPMRRNELNELHYFPFLPLVTNIMNQVVEKEKN